MGLIRSILLGDENESLPKPVVGLIGFVLVMAFAVELAIGFGSASLANVELLRSVGGDNPELAWRDLGRGLTILPRRYGSGGTAALLGKAYERHGDDLTAANIWEAGLAVAPSDTRMRYWLGNADDRLGLWSKAVVMWQRDPNVARLVSDRLLDQGVDALAEDALAESERLLLRSAEVDPTNPGPYYVLSDLYRRGSYAERGPGRSIQMARRAAALDPGETVEKHYALGTALALENNCLAASEEFRLVLLMDPEEIGALHSLGVCLLTLGEVDEGVALLEEAVVIVPTHYWSYVHLANVAEQRGDPVLAECYRRTAAYVQPFGDVDAYAAYARGIAPEPCI
jgi:tetratricopeptide (TPR) repeat protein